VTAQPVISDVGLAAYGYGDMVGSNTGTHLAVTHYSTNDYKAEVFDFDPVCGTVSHAIELYKEPVWDYPYGIAFSPDDSKLYIAYSYQLSQLIQYYGSDYQSSYFIASSPENFNIMRIGPDNRIYIATHDNGIPGERINAILNPDSLAGLCNFRETYLRLDEGAGFRRAAQFELPMFASGKTLKSPVKDSVFSYTGSCTGDTVKFRFNTGNPFDSVQWKFGDGSKESVLLNPVHLYKTGGRFAVELTIFRCGRGYSLKDTLNIDSFPVFHFPEDTMVCVNRQVVLRGPEAQKYTWSTGENTRYIAVDGTGIVWLSAANGNCTVADTINIINYPDLITQLGDEYFLCEDDDELVRLDAGEGFTHYRWTPTEDTTQWIIVRSTGEYFVKVTDNNGCIGNDETKVKRLCGVILHFPNAFTPDNDGLNDVYRPSGTDVLSFRINIYNRWGELVFTSNNYNKGWDGLYKNKPAAADVYTFQAEYTGYRNKRKQIFQEKGNITLLR
jgi:gliding motility-associated-like protein